MSTYADLARLDVARRRHRRGLVSTLVDFGKAACCGSMSNAGETAVPAEGLDAKLPFRLFYRTIGRAGKGSGAYFCLALNEPW